MSASPTGETIAPTGHVGPPEGATAVTYRRFTFGGISSNFLLSLLGAAFFLPLLWLIFASVDAQAGAGLRLPNLSIVHYQDMITSAQLRPFYNSFYLAGMATLISTVVALFAGYALSRRHVPFKGSFMLLILFMSGLPVAMLLVPTYQLFVTIDWLDSLFYTSLFIAATSLPFSIWLLKNFIDQVPRELEEAAAVEGASNLRVLLRVVLPLALPGIAVTAMVTFINAWGAFIIPLVLNSNPEDTPGSIAIYQFLSQNAQVMFGDLAAYSLMFAAPVIVLYLVVSRHISGAFTLAGGLKT